MKLLTRCISKTLNILIISILLLLAGINSVTNSTFYRYYNKNIEESMLKVTDKEVINLIILTVTGDKNYLTHGLESLYSSNNIIHLLVLSGSNIIIVIKFFEVFIRRSGYFSYIIKILLTFNYFIFTNYPYPLARAFIFMTITDFKFFLGVRFSKVYEFILISIFCLIIYVIEDFPLSFLLSYYFSMLIIIYGVFLRLKNPLLDYLYFCTYMAIGTYPLSFIFGNFSLFKTLMSNLATGFSYDFIVLLAYTAYLGAFILPRDLLTLGSLIIREYLNFLKYLSIHIPDVL